MQKKGKMSSGQWKKQNAGGDDDDDDNDGHSAVRSRSNGADGAEPFPSSKALDLGAETKTTTVAPHQSDSVPVASVSAQSARRASFSEAKICDGNGRKRSNEPIKRKSQEKQRKSTGDEIIEQRLAALAKENNALKSQLEEQIRLNSVIVANPSLASLSNAAANLPRIVFANGTNDEQQSNSSSSSLANTVPTLATAPPPFAIDEPSPFCALQKSERSAFSVIRPGNVKASAPINKYTHHQQNEQTTSADSQTAFSANTFSTNQQNGEFVRLAAQLAPFSVFPHHYHHNHQHHPFAAGGGPAGPLLFTPPLAPAAAAATQHCSSSSSSSSPAALSTVSHPVPTITDEHHPHQPAPSAAAAVHTIVAKEDQGRGMDDAGLAAPLAAIECGTTTTTAQCDQPRQNRSVQLHLNRLFFPNLSMPTNLTTDFSSAAEDNFGAVTRTAKAAALLMNSGAVTELLLRNNTTTSSSSTSDDCPLDFSKNGRQHQNTCATSTTAALRPKSVIISASQNDVIATTNVLPHLNLAPDRIVGQMSSSLSSLSKEDNSQQGTKQRTPIKLTMKGLPSAAEGSSTAALTADDETAAAPNGHWTPVIQLHKHGPPPSQPLLDAACDNANKLKMAPKTVTSMSTDVPSSSASSCCSSDLLLPLLLHPSPASSSSASSSSAFLPSLLTHHHPSLSSSSVSHFSPTPLLQLLMLRSRIGLVEKHGASMDAADPMATTATAQHAMPPIIAQMIGEAGIGGSANAASSSSSCSSSSSSSMLGTLLSMPPNDCRTSPTVPASRTEFCSGLVALSSGGSKKCADNERHHHHHHHQPHQQQQHQIDAKNSTTTVPNNNSSSNNNNNNNIDKASFSSSTLHSDSEQSSSSGGQNSPNSTHTLHSLHSHTSDSPPSTLPGAGSTMTTVCGSDRTRRGSSSPISGCSGDDSSSLLVVCDDQNAIAGRSRDEDDDERRVVVATKRRPTHSLNSPPLSSIASTTAAPTATATTTTPMRMKMRNSEELERYMDRRRRNNEAAKRCRANRRAVFEYRSRKAQLLEAENGELRQEMVKLNAELDQLKALIAAKAAARFSFSS